MSIEAKKVPLSEIKPHAHNANGHTERGRYMLGESIDRHGFAEAGTLDKNNVIIAGNHRTEVAADVLGADEAIVIDVDGTKPVFIRRKDLDITTPEGLELATALNRVAQVSIDLAPEVLKSYKDFGADLDWMWTAAEFEEMGFADGMSSTKPKEPAEAQTNKADELREKWGTEAGQLWILPARNGGQHRLLIGDCTDFLTVSRLMSGERADLLHADPPYGMGKEKDGIANDNLYNNKLDEFQMRWWHACRPHLLDNGSVYIWGNAESLWRLWYVGGLKDSERLTMRNEIVWDKESGQGMLSGDFRSFANVTERALFFMLGEQGFNNNADNYWDGWEPIRKYLKEQRDLMGWNNKAVADMFGFHPRMASHWFDESQWSFIKREQYAQLQQAANGDGFKREYDDLKREYDDLKREFYATRAYFDNAHEIMTDVWNYARVKGDDRHGHATPKPVEMMTRALKSSCPDGGLVLVPFAGTAPELIAAENTGRYFRGVELSAVYSAVVLQRYYDTFGIMPEVVKDGS